MTTNFNAARMIKKAATKPLSTAHRCRREMQKLEAGYHQRLYDIVTGAYAAAWHFRKGPSEWRRFLGKPFWKKAKKVKGEKGVREELHRVMMYVCDAVSDQAYDRAYKYARALEPYLIEKVPPERVRERIESDGGLEKLYDQATNQIPLRKPGKKPDDKDGKDAALGDDDFDTDEGLNDETGGQEQGRPQVKAKPGSQLAGQRPTLDIEISSKRLGRVFEMGKGQEAIVRIKSLGVENGKHRFEAIKVKVPREIG